MKASVEWAGGGWISSDNELWRRNFGGMAVIPASGICVNPSVTAHELGHAFGLEHDFRDDALPDGLRDTRTFVAVWRRNGWMRIVSSTLIQPFSMQWQRLRCTPDAMQDREPSISSLN